ncbi:MAG: hypothetical protein ACYDHG_12140 [Desulfomonilaceae bacterium]
MIISFIFGGTNNSRTSIRERALVDFRIATVANGQTFGSHPGKAGGLPFFGYACVDRSVPVWNVPSARNNWGTRPGKTIDPILGGQFTMDFKF